MDLGIGNRVALVTGASKGLGRAVAAALAAEGARVALTARSAERVEEAAADIGGLGVVHDSSDLDGIPALVGRVQKELGPVDILVTNTGGPPAGPDALAFSREQWEAAYRSLMLFPMAMIECTLPGMRERGWGRIVNVSSIAAREPVAPLMLSNAHRAGTLAAFKTIARQVAGDGVTLNSLITGRIATDRLAELSGSLENAQAGAREQVPAGRLGTAEEFAAAAVFLCSEPASYVTGTALPVDGGLMASI